MSRLTKNQLTRLGDSYLKLAQIVGAYRIENYNSLSTTMKKRIREYHKKLIDFSDSFYVTSTNYIINDAETSIKKIEDVTNQLNSTIKNIEKTQLVINAFGTAVQLGASIISQQPLAIVASINDFIKSLKKIEIRIKRHNT